MGCDVDEASGEGELVGDGVLGFGDETALCVVDGVGVGFTVATGVASGSEDGLGDGLCEGLGDGLCDGLS